MRTDPELIRLENWNTNYGGGGRLSTLVIGQSIAQVPQKADELLRAMAKAVICV